MPNDLHGELFEATFETSAGPIGFLAEALIDGTSLHLKDVVVEPRAAARLNPGTMDILKAKEQLFESARIAGFQMLRITAERLTGATVGKKVDLTFDLTK
jgi:hypothetical protein